MRNATPHQPTNKTTWGKPTGTMIIITTEPPSLATGRGRGEERKGEKRKTEEMSTSFPLKGYSLVLLVSYVFVSFSCRSFIFLLLLDLFVYLSTWIHGTAGCLIRWVLRLANVTSQKSLIFLIPCPSCFLCVCLLLLSFFAHPSTTTWSVCLSFHLGPQNHQLFDSLSFAPGKRDFAKVFVLCYPTSFLFLMRLCPSVVVLCGSFYYFLICLFIFPPGSKEPPVVWFPELCVCVLLSSFFAHPSTTYSSLFSFSLGCLVRKYSCAPGQSI